MWDSRVNGDAFVASEIETQVRQLDKLDANELVLQSCRVQRSIQVLYQVGGIFQPDIDPQHSLAHAHLGASFGAEPGVSR